MENCVPSGEQTNCPSVQLPDGAAATTVGWATAVPGAAGETPGLTAGVGAAVGVSVGPSSHSVSVSAGAGWLVFAAEAMTVLVLDPVTVTILVLVCRGAV